MLLAQFDVLVVPRIPLEFLPVTLVLSVDDE